MNIENKAWWRGSFPSWIVAGLIGVMTWMGMRLVKEHDRVIVTTEANREKIIMMDWTLTSHASQLQELKAINSKIVEQLEKLREDVRSAGRQRPALAPKQTP